MNGLVLSGGGARAAYQVGVLRYIAERVPEVRFPIVTGVSAGAINAAFLAGHRGSPLEAVADLARAWCELTIPRVFRADPISLVLSALRWIWTLGSGGTSLGPRVRGLLDTSPLWSYLTRCLDVPGIDANLEAGKLWALGLTSTRYSTGQTITFVCGRPEVPTWERSQRRGVPARIGVEHVMASCAIPLIFPAVKVGSEYYGDGSVRQAAPLAPAIHLGASRLLAIGTRYARSAEEAERRLVEGYPPPAQVISMLFNAIFLDALEADAERLERINRLLEGAPPGASNPDALRPIDLLVIRPSRDLGKLAPEYRDRLPWTVRFLLRGLGVHRVRGADVLSYLIFEEPYIRRLLELGYDDARSQWPEVESFLAGRRHSAGSSERQVFHETDPP